MSDNRFSGNDDFEDIFSNSSKNDDFENVYSNFAENNGFEDFSSFSSEKEAENSAPFSPIQNNDFSVKYNSPPVQNRRRQEIRYGDVSKVYETLIPENQNPESKKKKRHPIRNTILVLLALIIALSACAGVYGYSEMQKLLDSFDRSEPLKKNKYISDSELYSDSEQINILLIGTDAREGETVSRSDTMMLVTIDNKNKQIKLTSFLRDSYVQIAGGKKEKLNAAYFRGGVQGLVDTLELNFKVKIPYYALVDFSVFTEIVDAIGGISVDVTEAESYYTYHSGKIGVPVRIEAGDSVLLNGEEALWYSRIRYLDSDFMRTKRQRKVITAIADKAKQQSIPDLIKLAETVCPLIKTNMKSDEMMNYGLHAVLDKAYDYKIVQQQVPADGTWTNKTISGVGDCLVMDIPENTKIIEAFLKTEQKHTDNGTAK